MLPAIRKDLQGPSVEAAYPLAIAVALKDEVGNSRHAIKTLSRWTGASERTVQNWLAAVRGPSGPHLVALAVHSSAVHGAYLRMTGRRQPPAAEIEAATALIHEALSLLGMHTRN